MPGPAGPFAAILDDVERYYSAKVRRHGATALGVDWNSPMSQRLRFVQLLKVVDWSAGAFRLHDLGCGYGALVEHLQDRHSDANIAYVGTDLSPAMIRHARRLWVAHTHAHFEPAGPAMPSADYTVASGIFNVCLGHGVEEWEAHVAATLTQINSASERGFAVNFMTPRVWAERPATRGQLYAAVPERWIEHCASVLACEVRCVQAYGLNEFTLLATKSRSRAMSAT